MKILMREFEKNPNWSKETLLEVSKKTGLSEAQVYKWGWDQKRKTFGDQAVMMMPPFGQFSSSGHLLLDPEENYGYLEEKVEMFQPPVPKKKGGAEPDIHLKLREETSNHSNDAKIHAFGAKENSSCSNIFKGYEIEKDHKESEQKKATKSSIQIPSQDPPKLSKKSKTTPEMGEVPKTLEKKRQAKQK